MEAGPLQKLRGRSWRTQPEPATLSQHAAREKKKGSVTLLISDHWKRAAHFHISHCESTNSGLIGKDGKSWAFFPEGSTQQLTCLFQYMKHTTAQVLWKQLIRSQVIPL